MNYFIGIDGGGTGTRCVLTDGNLNLLAHAGGGPSNPLSVGIEKSANLLYSLIEKVLKLSGIKEADFILIGLAGAGRVKTAERLKNTLIKLAGKKKTPFRNIEVTSDIVIALEGALPSKSGAVLISGTGSIVFGKDDDGNFFRAGGLGKILADDGSGYSIGKKGLAAVAREFDGRAGSSLLSKMILKDFNISNVDELITRVYNDKFDVAGFAPYVIRAAGKGDKISARIIDEELNELLLLVKTITKKISVKELNLCLGGGLLTSKNYYSLELKKRISAKFKYVKLTKQVYQPELGAVLIAKKIIDKLNLT